MSLENERKSSKKKVVNIKKNDKKVIKKSSKKTQKEDGNIATLGHNKNKSFILATDLMDGQLLVDSEFVLNNNDYRLQHDVAGNAFKEDLGSDSVQNKFILTRRVAGIDAMYFSNILGRRHYAVDHLMDVMDRKNNDMSKKYLNVINNIDNRNADHDFKFIFDNSIGIQKDLKGSGCAYSFLSKYGHCLTKGNFPIYDSVTREMLINYFGCKVVNNVKNIDHLRAFFINVKQVCEVSQIYKSDDNYEIDYRKFDHFVWLFTRIEKGAFSSILNVAEYGLFVQLLGLDSDGIQKSVNQYQEFILENKFDSKEVSELTNVNNKNLKKEMDKLFLSQDNYIFHAVRLSFYEGSLPTLLKKTISNKDVRDSLERMISFVINKYDQCFDDLFRRDKVQDIVTLIDGQSYSFVQLRNGLAGKRNSLLKVKEKAVKSVKAGRKKDSVSLLKDDEQTVEKETKSKPTKKVATKSIKTKAKKTTRKTKTA